MKSLGSDMGGGANRVGMCVCVDGCLGGWVHGWLQGSGWEEVGAWMGALIGGGLDGWMNREGMGYRV